MLTRAPLRPGQKGTHRFAQKYGEHLACVRCRYDYPDKTVELIIDDQSWEPPPPHPQQARTPARQAHYTRQARCVSATTRRTRSGDQGRR